jgi:hypothetical protein
MNEVRGQGGAERAAALLKAAYEYSAFYASMLVFSLLCLSCSLFALPPYALLPRRRAIACGRYCIMAGFRLYSHWLALLRVYRLDVSAIDALRGGPPLILAPNHPSLMDAPLLRKGWRFGMRPSLPITYRLRLGRRVDPSPDVDAFVAELERYYRGELQSAPTCR